MVSCPNPRNLDAAANNSSDHLFASWSQMQANKADQDVMRDLRQWLENPNVSAGAGMGQAKEDLAWLENSKDLSSVNLGGKSEKPATRRPSTVGGGGGRGSSGGFASWFNSCAGKRK
jgi:hypothetical protein